MTLEQLRIFVAVAEREHMTRASEALGLVQSAVSAAIAALEARHKTALFHRLGRRIELTEAGRIFLEEARAVLARAAAAEQALAELGNLNSGTLAVHASQTIASYWLPRHLVRFHQTYPYVSIRLSIGNSAQVAKAVLEGESELGFIEGHVDAAPLEDRIISGDRLVIVTSRAHPWTQRERIAPGDLLGSDWVLRERGSGTRSEFEEALKQVNLSPAKLRVVMELPSNEAVRAAVEASGGATALSELVVSAAIAEGRLCRIGFDLPTRDFHVLRHPERYQSKAAEAFLGLLDARQPEPV